MTPVNEIHVQRTFTSQVHAHAGRTQIGEREGSARTVEVPVSEAGHVRVPPEPFVAGWSDGRKTPPPKLAELMEFMDAHSLTPDQLLDIPELSNANFSAYQGRMQELQKDLARKIELAEGTSARVGDILAVKGYRRLKH